MFQCVCYFKYFSVDKLVGTHIFISFAVGTTDSA